MSSYLQELFSESPYAAAVATKHLRTHCSNCFEKAKSGCSKCSSVVYCDRNCQAADWPWHKAECQAFLRRRLEPETASINERERERESQDEEFVRILGRVLIRRRKDNGEVSLSEKFPVFAKNRSFNDLMSHVDDLDRAMVNKFLSQFHRFFKGQHYLDNVDEDELRCTLSRIIINDFSVNGPPDARGNRPALGVALYLNASRFDHTCERSPRVIADFDGCRIRFQFVATQEEVNTGKIEKLLPKTEEEFDRLTFSYGFGKFHWTSVPWIQQRRECLQEGYCFECHCPRCDDQMDAILAWDACSRECPQCRMPYILRGTIPGQVLIACQCRLDPKQKKVLDEWLEDPYAREECKKLETEYESVLSVCTRTKSPLVAIAAGEPLRLLASEYWHPILNLRFVQLNELLFAAYRSLALSHFIDHPLFKDPTTPMYSYIYDITPPSASTKDTTITISDPNALLRLALKLGELVARAYDRHLTDHDSRHTAQWLFMGELLELAFVLAPECVIFRERAKQYYETALQSWMRRGIKGSEKCMDQLKYRIDRICPPIKIDQAPAAASSAINDPPISPQIGPNAEPIVANLADRKIDQNDTKTEPAQDPVDTMKPMPVETGDHKVIGDLNQNENRKNTKSRKKDQKARRPVSKNGKIKVD